jgi:hypothetical protein
MIVILLSVTMQFQRVLLLRVIVLIFILLSVNQQSFIILGIIIQSVILLSEILEDLHC